MNKRFRLMDENGGWSDWIDEKDILNKIEHNKFYKAVHIEEEMATD